MPCGDRTGPLGQGPMSGRGFGCCDGEGNRRGFKRGSGWKNQMYKTVELNKEEQRKILEAEKQEIEKRLKEME